MSKIGNTTDYAVTTPESADMVIGTDVSNTSNDSTGETVNFLMSDIASFVLGPSAPFSFCQVRNTDTSTNINQATAANIPFGGTNDATDSDYTLASDSITVNFDGVVSVQAHISQSGSVARSNVGIWITNNNTKVSGVGQSGYIRAASGHNESSSHVSATFAVSDGDVIRVQGKQRAASGTVNQIAGESQVTVERRS